MSPFDIINSISHSKEDLRTEETFEKDYNSFMINRGLSYFNDTILYANQMNMYSHLDKDMQYSFLINTIRTRKRFSKWHKKRDESELDPVMKLYNVNIHKAREIYSILSSEQKQKIKELIGSE